MIHLVSAKTEANRDSSLGCAAADKPREDMTGSSSLSNPSLLSALLAALSHELGSPLAAIKGAATTLIDYRQRLPAERYFLQGFHRWHVEWIEVVGVASIVLPTDPIWISVQTIAGLTDKVRDHGENSGNVRLIAQPGAVSLDRVAQQYARVTTGIGTDQLWTALRQWGATTLTGGRGRRRALATTKIRGRGLLKRGFCCC
jgi:hypothetical protein